jgi:hypothetical protein
MSTDLKSIAPFHQQAHEIGEYLHDERSRDAEARRRESDTPRTAAEPSSID